MKCWDSLGLLTLSQSNASWTYVLYWVLKEFPLTFYSTRADRSLIKQTLSKVFSFFFNFWHPFSFWFWEIVSAAAGIFSDMSIQERMTTAVFISRCRFLEDLDFRQQAMRPFKNEAFSPSSWKAMSFSVSSAEALGSASYAYIRFDSNFFLNLCPLYKNISSIRWGGGSPHSFLAPYKTSSNS